MVIEMNNVQVLVSASNVVVLLFYIPVSFHIWFTNLQLQLVIVSWEMT